MNIVINASTLNKGGSLQVAFSIVQEISQIGDNNKYLILCSPSFMEQISHLNLPKKIELKLIQRSPAKLLSRRKIIKKLDGLINEFGGEIVLTVFGPSYWKPKVKHICGFADGWCYYPNTIAYKVLNPAEHIKRRLLSWYKLKHLIDESDYFFIETEDAKTNLIKVTGISENKISVISNTYSSVYSTRLEQKRNILPNRISQFRFLVLSANYPHKNLVILNNLIPMLSKRINSFEFITTIPQREYAALFSTQAKKKIFNLGPIDVQDCVLLYQEIDFLFLPTLLETFTATYPEAMKMNVPILTSDLSFARDICGNAAVYFDPIDAKDITNKICEVITNPRIINILKKEGEEQLQKFPSARDRALQLLNVCNKIKSQ